MALYGSGCRAPRKRFLRQVEPSEINVSTVKGCIKGGRQDTKCNHQTEQTIIQLNHRQKYIKKYTLNIVISFDMYPISKLKGLQNRP